MQHGKHVKKMQNIFTDKLRIESDLEIDSCHKVRSCKRKTGQDQDRTHTVVSRLNRFKDKQHILNNVKKLKNMDMFIYEDFSQGTIELRKSLWEQVLKYRKQSRYACLNYRNIIVRDDNGVR